MRKLLVLVTALLCLTLTPIAAGAQATAATTTARTRPFAALFLGSVIPGGSNVAGVFVATHLGFGHFTVASSLLESSPVTVFGTHAVLTATDGETLVSDGAIVELPSNTPNCQGDSIVGGAIFTGGTGRFANATGSVQTFGCIHRDVSPARVTAFSLGTITF